MPTSSPRVSWRRCSHPLKDDRRSEEAYRRVVGIDPFDRDAQAAYGRLAMKRKDGETAAACLPRRARQQPARSCDGARRSGRGLRGVGAGGRGEEGNSGSARDRAVIRARTGSAAEGRREPPAVRDRSQSIVPPLDLLALRPPEREHPDDAGAKPAMCAQKATPPAGSPWSRPRSSRCRSRTASRTRHRGRRSPVPR